MCVCEREREREGEKKEERRERVFLYTATPHTDIYHGQTTSTQYN